MICFAELKTYAKKFGGRFYAATRFCFGRLFGATVVTGMASVNAFVPFSHRTRRFFRPNLSWAVRLPFRLMALPFLFTSTLLSGTCVRPVDARPFWQHLLIGSYTAELAGHPIRGGWFS